MADKLSTKIGREIPAKWTSARDINVSVNILREWVRLARELEQALTWTS